MKVIFSFLMASIVGTFLLYSCVFAPIRPKVVLTPQPSGTGSVSRDPDHADDIYIPGDLVTIAAYNTKMLELKPLNLYQDADGPFPAEAAYRFSNWTNDLKDDALFTEEKTHILTVAEEDLFLSANFKKYGVTKRTISDAAGTTVTGIETYTYNSNNRLAEYAIWDATGTTKQEHYTYEYSEAGLLSKNSYFSGGAFSYYYTYAYNTDGTLAKREKYLPAGGRDGYYDYAYTAGRLTQIIWRENDVTTIKGYTDLEYNAQAQLLKIKESSIALVLLSSAAFTYDDNGRCVSYATFTGASETAGDYYAWAYDTDTGEITGYKKYDAAGNTLAVYGFTLADF